MIFGLERLLKSEFQVFPLYKNESEKRNVKLTFLPAQKRTEDYCIILLAGGAYGAVCTMVESLPVAAKFNESGIDCFVSIMKRQLRTALKKVFCLLLSMIWLRAAS